MKELVLIALRRPYTFVVLALLILLFGAISVLRTADGHLSAGQNSGHRSDLDL